jgi:transcriptional regulator with XRE-family HTH domain
VSENVPPGLKKVGDEIRQLRELSGMRQEDLAEESHISLSVIKELEAGKYRTRRARGTLKKLSKVFGKDPEYLDDIMWLRREPDIPDAPKKPEKLEDQVIRTINELREDVSGKFSALEEQLRKIAAEQVRQGNEMTERFDALNRHGGPGEVSVELPQPSHGKDAPEK